MPEEQSADDRNIAETRDGPGGQTRTCQPHERIPKKIRKIPADECQNKTYRDLGLFQCNGGKCNHQSDYGSNQHACQETKEQAFRPHGDGEASHRR
jgi:hypothetical protein